MRSFIDSVKLSLKTKNWYAALTVALTLPDIAGKVDYPNLGVGARYEMWYNVYLLEKYKWTTSMKVEEVMLSGKDCYALRCAFLQEGVLDIAAQKARVVLEDFIFFVPNEENNINHKNKLNNTLLLDIPIFCNDIIEGVEKWLLDIHDDKDKQQTITDMAKLYLFRA